MGPTGDSSAASSPAAPSACPPPGVVCRICQSDDETLGILISPCLCDGSVRWVHASCLDEWRLRGGGRASRATTCELCDGEYRFELQEASGAEAALASVRRVGDYTLAVLLFTVLGLAACLCGVSAAWSVWVEPCGFVLFVLALGDLLAPLSESCAPRDCSRGGCERRASSARPGSGTLLSSCGQLLLTARLDGRAARSLTELLANEEAQQQAEATLLAAAQAEAHAEMALLGELGMSGAPLALASGAAPAPSVAAQADAGVSWSLGCCAQVVFFCGMHACLGVYWWCLKQGFGLKFLSPYTSAAAVAGVAYWLASALALYCASVMRDPLRAVISEEGLPVVRTLRPEERARCWDRGAPPASPPEGDPHV